MPLRLVATALKHFDLEYAYFGMANAYL